MMRRGVLLALATVCLTTRPFLVDTQTLSSDFDLQFPEASTSNFVLMLGTLPDLHALTLSLWMRTTDQENYGTPFSYANRGPDGQVEDNAFTIIDYKSVAVLLNGQPLYTGQKLNSDSDWHHLAFTWNSTNGHWAMYVDGSLRGSGDWLKTGSFIRGSGALVLGQDQDSFAGSFQQKQSFVGNLSQVNMWDYAMTQEEISVIYVSCAVAGNVLAWPQVRSSIHGDVLIIHSSDHCAALSNFDLRFPLASTSNFVLMEDTLPDLHALTLSFWMRTMDQENAGTVFSYAAGARFWRIEDNAFLIYNYKSVVIVLNDEYLHTDQKLNSDYDYDWHHVAVTWNSTDGHWAMYVDGALKRSGDGVNTGSVVQGSGALVLGQDQDSYAGSFDQRESFIGDLSQVNMWDYAMTQEEISEIYSSCAVAGNVLAWSQVRSSIHGDVLEIQSSGHCAAMYSDFDLQFPKASTSNFILMKDSLPDLHALTLSFWMRTTDQENAGTPFSYATRGPDGQVEDNAFTIFDYKSVVIILNGQSVYTNQTLNSDYVWHHVAVTWDSTDGHWAMYVDGSIRGSGDGLMTGSFIRGSGAMVLGQDQGSFGGSFNQTQSFIGDLSQVNMWDYAMKQREISVIYSSCVAAGNVLAWSQARSGIHGDVLIIESSGHCAALSSDFDLQFTQASTSNFVLMKGALPDLHALTLSFWMRTEDQENDGTPFSYATRKRHGWPRVEDNAFTIYNYKNVLIILNGQTIYTEQKLNSDSDWHHVAVTWNSTDGHWAMYVDRTLKRSADGFMKGAFIPGSGALVLGQDQDSFAGSFDQSESFIGDLSQVNMWDYAMTQEEISEIYSSCAVGNVLAWTQVRSSIHGDVLINQSSKHCADFDLQFPNATTSNFILMQGTLPELHALTLSFWMRTEDQENEGTVFSYATRGPDGQVEDNAFTISNYKGVVIILNGQSIYTDQKLNRDYDWHHVAITWNSTDGYWAMYVDGALRGSGDGVKTGSFIRGSGALVLGQDQDSFAGSFNQTESFIGDLSQVNMWDYAMTQEEISVIYSSCAVAGNMLAWSQVRSSIHGDVLVIQSSGHCAALSSDDFDLHFPQANTSNFVLMQGILPDLHALTLSFWMRTEEQWNVGTQFSYATWGPDGRVEDIGFSISGNHLVSFTVNDMSRFPYRLRLTREYDWHHVAFTWNSTYGDWAMYLDGTLEESGGIKMGAFIRGSGALVLGQRQRSVAGSFAQTQSFIGDLSQMNMWDYAMTQEEISVIYSSCAVAGNVLAWSQVRSSIHGDVLIIESSKICGEREPPMVIYCPDNIEVESNGRSVNVTWTEPTFQDNSGLPVVGLKSTRDPPSEFTWGPPELVTYQAGDRAGNKATCEFTVTVKVNSCPYHPPPLNGALACDFWLGGQFCSVSCNENFDSNRKPHHIYYCWVSPSNNLPTWLPAPFDFGAPPFIMPWPDCTEKRDPKAQIGLEEDFFTGSCDQNATAEIAQDFVRKMDQVDPRFGLCEDGCSMENVNVTCGPTTDQEPPRVIYCPDNIEIESSVRIVQVNWTEPTFKDNSGQLVVRLISNHGPQSEFTWGPPELVTYQAEDSAGNKETCEFTVTVKANSCPYYPPPLNGALACDFWLGGQFCSVSCNENFDFNRMPQDIYYCRVPPHSNQASWAQAPHIFFGPPFRMPWPDCTEKRNPQTKKGLEVDFFTGSCDQNAKAEIAQDFVRKMGQIDPRFGFCGVGCSMENVNVTCGPTTAS